MLTVQTLIDDLAAGCKPKGSWRIGLEHEQFAYDKATGLPLAYDGAPGIRHLIETFAAEHGWERKQEDGNTIALAKNGMTVSLEPGGQVEYSGSPLPTLAAAQDEMNAFYAALEPLAARLGIGFIRAGFPPHWRREDMHWMPKARYRIMGPYMEKVGALGVDMMLRTCGAQVNLDFDSEQDMVKKYRVALALQPVVTALMANSRMKEGRDSGHASYRAHIWTDTDPQRCGIPGFVFADGMGFAHYAEYALDVPMYFIRRDGRYIDVAGQSFRAFMAGKLPGHEDEFPTLEDWHDHLSTLFPDIRLKRYLELRGPDSNDPPLVMAMAAFWTGVLYHQETLDHIYSLIASWPLQTHEAVRRRVSAEGLSTTLDTQWKDLRDFAAALLPLAEGGLRDESERALLAPFHARLTGQDAALKAAS